MRRYIAQGRGVLYFELERRGRVEFVNACFDSPSGELLIEGDFGGSVSQLSITPSYLLSRGLILYQIGGGFTVTLTRYDDVDKVYCVDVRGLEFEKIRLRSGGTCDYFYSIIEF